MLVTSGALFLFLLEKSWYTLLEVVIVKDKECQQCENYRFAVVELRKQALFKTVKFVSVLAFVAVLVAILKSYTPCLFLLLLLL